MSNCNYLITKLGTSNKENCFSNSTVAEENGKKFILINRSQKRVCRVMVDGCLITSQTTQKCDYMFEVSGDPSKYYLIELKGVDRNSSNTARADIDYLQRRLKASPESYKEIIVSSRVPAASDQKLRRFQEKLLKDKGLAVTRRTNQYEEKI